MAQKNILFISYDGMTDPLGQSQVLPYLLGLSKHGYKIFLISSEKEQAFAQNKTIVEELIKNSGITWVPLNYTKKPPVLSTMIDIYKIKKAAKKIHQQYKLDMVHTRPGVPALIGMWMKKKFGIKFLNDIRDFYADSRVDGKMWDLKNPLYNTVYKYFKRKEDEQIEINDGIVCLTAAAEKVVRALPQFKRDTPLEVIPCSADLQLFNRSNISEQQTAGIKNELGIQPSDVIIAYLGSVGGLYLTEEMMHFCKTVSTKIPAAKFLFISPNRHEEIAAAAASYGIDKNKLIIKKAARKEVPLFLSVSHFSVFFIKPCFSRKAQSPTKHGEIMAMGIPVITNYGIGDVEEIIQQYNSGIVIKGFNEEEYEVVAERISSGYSFDPKMIRQGAENFYDLSSAIKKYKRIYESILPA
jgi:glycosyltransferase involved in cell wall biosynthesis